MVKGHALIRKITQHEALPAGVVVVGRIGAHASAGGAGLAIGQSSRDSHIGKGTVVIVVVELVGLSIVADEEVEPSVVVIVKERDTQRLAGGIVESRASGYILERSISFVMEKRRTLAFIPLRSAVGLILVVEGAILVSLNRPVDVVGDEKIQLAVIVVVKPHGTGGKSWVGHPSLGGDIGKLTIA